MLFLGIDTSNYTTSLALYDSITNTFTQRKELLPVKNGELGLRQSNAVFHHIKQINELMKKLINNTKTDIAAIGVSDRPRNIENSYMPCFLVGETIADCIGQTICKPVYKTSHQIGHILSALYSSDKIELVNKEFIAFHVSGGTTDCLLCKADKKDILNITEIGTSLDLKAGQAIDRIGVMLGLEFPCGIELEKLAAKSTREYKISPFLRGNDCSLSGIENKCRKMFSDNENSQDIAKYCITYIYETINKMTDAAINKYGELPVIYAGGVMSDKIIKDRLSAKDNRFFSESLFSSDNAAGVAYFSYINFMNQD